MSIESERLLRIEERLSRLESYLAQTKPAPVEPSQPVPPKIDDSHPATRKPAPSKVDDSHPAAWRPTPQVTSKAPESGVDKPGSWLGFVGIVCFVLAAAFIVKLSIDTGWLTPVRQVGISALFGLSLIGCGLFLLERDKEYASLLPAAGVVVLYLTTFASHLIYPLISLESALGATSLVSCLCILLYTKIRHDIYPMTAAVGAYVSPLVLGVSNLGVFSLYYFIICSLAFSVISIWIESRILTIVSAYLAILISSWAGLSMEEDSLMLVGLAAHVFIFAVGTFLHTRQTMKPLDAGEAWGFFPVLLLFYAMEYFYLDRIAPDLAPWLSLVFAAFLLGLYLMAKSKLAGRDLASGPMIMAFITGVVFHSVYIELLPGDFRPWLFAILLLVFAMIPTRASSLDSRGLFYFPFIGLILIVGLEFISMAFHLLTSDESSWVAVSLASVASLWAVIALKSKDLPGQMGAEVALLTAAHSLAILGLYRLTKNTDTLAVSASWLGYAIAVLAFGYTRRDKAIVKSAMLVLGLAAAKALLYDASAAPTVVRIVCLLLTGAALYGSGFLIRKISAWK